MVILYHILPLNGVWNCTGCRLARTTFNSLAVSVSLKFEGPQFSIEWSVGDIWKHQVVGQVQDINSVDIVVEEVCCNDTDIFHGGTSVKGSFYHFFCRPNVTKKFTSI